MSKLPHLRHERRHLKDGSRFVAGVDEAGRGPLAGPVVAAAVILDLDRVPKGLADSKLLPLAERERLFAEIMAKACVSVAAASAAEIDRLNIRGATLKAMGRAIAGLCQKPCSVLVDGKDLPRIVCRGEAVIDGDALSKSIAAASIVAKVARDRMMARMARVHPGYGFETNKGYSTREHLAALDRLGPTPMHRRSFRPISQLTLELEVA
ncbi:ribonuclease HII [Lutibaculum baratangense]|uniref:Ribonuclease HII n=1 Tax=Lutibaculum baratangense AMV1 TaxID=631454 RepID=V4TK01_9HYPH|nr:ribonuclease HII [Lutibaculum baratangense]ESR26218.1 Ribonuclease HII [Lutibaculum baratangense AMV1]